MTRQKVVLVTGASSGIGYAVSVEFAKRGYKVYACARRTEPMEPLKEFGIVPVSCDVTSLHSIGELRSLIASECDGFLDILLNNAGQSLAMAALDLDDADVARCFEVNVYAPIKLTREFAPLLIKAKGTVGFTGSVAAFSTTPFMSIYSATKAALASYVKTLRLELKPLHVTVINIVSGMVATNIKDDRDFPEESLYRVPGYEQFMEAKKNFLRDNGAMPSETYAHKVVNDFERARLGGSFEFYRGKFSSLMKFLAGWVPDSIVENEAVKALKVQQMFDYLTGKYA